MLLPKFPILPCPPKHVAVIVIHQHEDGRHTYDWKGKSSWPILVSHEFEMRAVAGWQDNLPWQLEKVAIIANLPISLYRRVEVEDAPT